MYGVQTQVDVREDRLGGTDDRSKFLEAVGLQTGLELGVEDGTRLLGVGVWVTPYRTALPATEVHSEEYYFYPVYRCLSTAIMTLIWYNTREVSPNEA